MNIKNIKLKLSKYITLRDLYIILYFVCLYLLHAFLKSCT